MVWHHRRNSVRRFWKQQYNYGAAEGQLERKWPQRYPAGGHVAWTGRLYDQGLAWIFGHSRRRIYHGTWGSALFQSVYQASAGLWLSLGLMPEWYLLIALLALTSLAGIAWRPMLMTAPLLVLAVCVPVAQAVTAARRATFFEARESRGRLARATCLTALLHLTQPLARLFGRMRRGMTPWRLLGKTRSFELPKPRTHSVWYETWQSGEQRLETLEKRVREQGVVTLRGGDYDRWDLQLRGGLLGAARVRLTIEEHGSGKQMVRYRAWPNFPTGGTLLAALCAAGAVVAGVTHGWTACAVLGVLAIGLAARAILECGAAMGAVRQGVAQK
jgi:hypothetical protein